MTDIWNMSNAMAMNRSLSVWFLCMAGAIANGVLREYAITPWAGDAWGHLLSTILLCGIILLIGWGTIRWMAPSNARQAWTIGVMWLVLTLAFEFGVGRVISGKSWGELFADYNLMQGRVWVFVPVIMLLSPLLMARGRGLIR